MAVTVLISSGGLRRGIELGNKIMMPGLFLILVGLGIYAMRQGDAAAALRFLSHGRPCAVERELVLAAVGQAFATGAAWRS